MSALPGSDTHEPRPRLRAVIINLAHDHTKREVMIEHMQALGIHEFEIIEASDGEDAHIASDQKSLFLEGRSYGYGPYEGPFPFRREHLSRSVIGCAISNHRARNNQRPGYYTIVFEDDARLVCTRNDWERYTRALPDQADFDLILLSDCTWSSTPYKLGRRYNDCFAYLPLPYFDISGTHAYIANPQILELLNSQLTFRLAADDYLNYCINRFRLRALVARDVLFSQRPASYRPLSGHAVCPGAG
jgi:GR25 family glycosyltransferase involved in LPS biosynthesis